MKSLWISMLGLISANTTAATAVHLPEQDVILQYQQTVRLSQVLGDSTQQQSSESYYLANKLFDNRKQAEIEALKQNVIARLAELRQQPDYVQSAQTLIEQLNSKRYGYRLALNLDYDFVRLSVKSDPMLPGDYTLVTHSRSKDIEVVGLVASPNLVTHQPTILVSDYLNSFSYLPHADISTTWLITPDGNTSPVGIGIWNKHKRTLAPGSILFVGFAPIDKQLKQLNLDIVTLLNSVVSPL